jgi:RHS repeat-associated protein
MPLEAPSDRTYSYAGIAYANPHAVTQIANGVGTTTYSYDNNGNLTLAGAGSATTTYSYDYANRLIAILYNNATTSQYGYDAFGTRVYQITASTSAATTTYPFKFFSIASTTKGTNNFATSTEYVFNGETLVATVDQAFKNGSATGTAQTRFIHPDHLGSTNVVTNASGTAVQTLDFYPYGATRINSSVGGADSARKYIGQFSDQSNLSYLNARYYDTARGQFLSEDPTFLAIGNQVLLRQFAQQEQAQFLMDPQLANSYNYGRDNPISFRDVLGLEAKIFSNNPVIATLEYFSYISALKDIGDYMQARYSNQNSSTATKSNGAQAAFDVVTTGAGFLAKKAEGIGLTLAGTGIQLIDYYCTGNTCSNFADSQKTPPQAILNNLNNASGPNLKAINAAVSGTPPKSYWGQTQPMNKGGGGSGQQVSPSYSQFVSNLSSFVTSLSAYVNSVKSSSTNIKSN